MTTRPCIVCGNPVPDGPQVYRRRTCSDACRQKLYRRRGKPPGVEEQRKDAVTSLREALRLCRAAQAQVRDWRLAVIVSDLEKVLEGDRM
jgi:hypothetical protein